MMDEGDAQSALEAVLPALREAWDDGYFIGAMDEREDPRGKAKSPNPYRVLRPGQPAAHPTPEPAPVAGGEA